MSRILGDEEKRVKRQPGEGGVRDRHKVEVNPIVAVVS